MGLKHGGHWSNAHKLIQPDCNGRRVGRRGPKTYSRVNLMRFLARTAAVPNSDS